ncbi:MAG TPA: Vi polysaccharide biosynthesis UDP-N-acetylglucosamine C-6 dehydrogenase TviB [Rhodanobacteraceae bacterium]|nr:Vi polysaccharide biosynthesis UDP-N-acetylglucosamine C-6 dehydrogenase TviB [Rhodanobacteraceae bacterium]
MHSLHDLKIAVVGLGYVGLPLAIEFGKQFDVVGFDINDARVRELREGHDHTREASPEELASATGLVFTSDPQALKTCHVFIVTAPTPVDAHKRPDLTSLIMASRTIGEFLKPGDVVVYESTVYPGATEEVCVPELESVSGLRFNEDFTVGYSPERINPGDKQHRVVDIPKVTSGSTPETAEFVDSLYRKIIRAGTHKAPCIKVAEAAKVIENTQRDINIALINDLAVLFHKLGIDTMDVLEAAGTKWNFLAFRPGLVGGHCIGVDPYYLTHKAQQVGHHPDLILAGRRTNDGMGRYIASEVVRLIVCKGINPVGARILLLGLAFKENCPDLRNTRVVDIVETLRHYNVDVDVHDPWVDADEAERAYAIRPVGQPEPGTYDAVVVTVGHRQFVDMGGERIRALGKPTAVLYDVKGILPSDIVDARL